MVIPFINQFFHGTLKVCLKKLLRLLDLVITTTENNLDHQKIKIKFNGTCLVQDQFTYTPQTVVNIYIVYEITKKNSISDYPTLENCLFGSVKLTKNPDIDKYKYSGCGIGFDRKGSFSFGNGYGQM